MHTRGYTPWALGPANSATHSYAALYSGCPLAKFATEHLSLTIDHQKLDVVHIHTSSTSSLIELHAIVAGVSIAHVRLVEDHTVSGSSGSPSHPESQRHQNDATPDCT